MVGLRLLEGAPESLFDRQSPVYALIDEEVGEHAALGAGQLVGKLVDLAGGRDDAVGTGDARADEVLKEALKGMRALRDSPPADMPQPIKIRVTSRA